MFDFFKKKNESELQENDEQKNSSSFFGISFDGLKKAISNTTQNLIGNVVDAVQNEEEFDEFILDDMEELLIKADLGVGVASEIVDKLRKQNTIKPSAVKSFLRTEFESILLHNKSSELNFSDNGLNIYFITGVNGAGKTTLIGKLANRFKNLNKKVLVAAGDTFRAAAEEQLNIWSDRAGADIYRKDGIDSAAVVYDAIKKAQNENYDVLLIDTAGRLQNKHNLMQELSKVYAVINKLAPESLKESILVLDANTGQNGLAQAKIFAEVANLTSVALTKLDGSAKGGIIISIAKELNLPVKLVGVGEKMTDLKDFVPTDFIEALFK
ncbi:MAG: signal recognition particle-docking protein FtsY [Candidatus Gastranaerophilales bacterium]|nr:signal recognition particle-docking protein FtsY [Candidatus Gastranaerophilales bacterium]